MTKWNETVNIADVFHDESMAFEARRDAIVGRIKASKWRSRKDNDLEDCVDNLAESMSIEEFDFYWGELYDLADFDRVWIKTF